MVLSEKIGVQIRIKFEVKIADTASGKDRQVKAILPMIPLFHDSWIFLHKTQI